MKFYTLVFSLYFPIMIAPIPVAAAGKSAAAHAPEKLSVPSEVSQTVVPFSISSDPQVNLDLRLKVISQIYAKKKQK